eukprot:TRINITY_DN49247_c0_g1_i1.p1 TRINITY_DN49247_c0_g1~~TRINITY_DN49247_c0_g1_i1.p1  ORF type:complete len:382 (+),score=47.77 TRINITY_DN49247_c0_g1_i1:28-1173(+)
MFSCSNARPWQAGALFLWLWCEGFACVPAAACQVSTSHSGAALASQAWRSQAHRCLGIDGSYMVAAAARRALSQSVSERSPATFGVCIHACSFDQRSKLPSNRSALVHIVRLGIQQAPSREAHALPRMGSSTWTMMVLSRLTSPKSVRVNEPWPPGCLYSYKHGDYNWVDHGYCRALDDIERTRFFVSSYSWPVRPLLIVCSGGMRTGSTWTFNAVRLLFRWARQALDSYYLHNVNDEDSLLARMSAGAHVLVKTHPWSKVLAQHADFIISTRRDLQGVARSLACIGWTSEGAALGEASKQYTFHESHWLRVSDLVIDYDSVQHQPLAVLQALTQLMGLAVTEAGLQAVLAHVSELPDPTAVYINQTSKLLIRHKCSGYSS